MPGYTITEVLRELGIGIARLRKLMAACGIEPVSATNAHGKVKIISREQLAQLRERLEATALTTATITSSTALLNSGSDQTLDTRFAAVWSELQALRRMIEVSQVNFSSRGHFSTSTERQESNSRFQPGQIGIGKTRAASLAARHGANSEYAAKGWLCWNAETLASDATAIMTIKGYLTNPRYHSGEWTQCSDETCSCGTL